MRVLGQGLMSERKSSLTLFDPCPGCGIECEWLYFVPHGVCLPEPMRIECQNPVCPGAHRLSALPQREQDHEQHIIRSDG